MTTVGLITYHFPHLKTEQVLQKLLQKKEKGKYDYKIYALPFKPRKQRGLFKHRLDQLEAVIVPVTLQRKSGDSRSDPGASLATDQTNALSVKH